MITCPKCGGKPDYVGLNTIECSCNMVLTASECTINKREWNKAWTKTLSDIIDAHRKTKEDGENKPELEKVISTFALDPNWVISPGTISTDAPSGLFQFNVNPTTGAVATDEPGMDQTSPPDRKSCDDNPTPDPSWPKSSVGYNG